MIGIDSVCGSNPCVFSLSSNGSANGSLGSSNLFDLVFINNFFYLVRSRGCDLLCIYFSFRFYFVVVDMLWFTYCLYGGVHVGLSDTNLMQKIHFSMSDFFCVNCTRLCGARRWTAISNLLCFYHLKFYFLSILSFCLILFVFIMMDLHRKHFQIGRCKQILNISIILVMFCV